MYLPYFFLGDVQRTQIASIITNPSQTPTVTIARPSHITLTTSVVAGSQPSGTATYHVPRGPAVVANLAPPRSAVASPIRAPGLATTPSSQPTSFVTAVRQVSFKYNLILFCNLSLQKIIYIWYIAD